jgi:hypothetical protein
MATGGRMTTEQTTKVQELLTRIVDEASRGLRACGATPDEALIAEHVILVARFADQCRTMLAPAAVPVKKKR